MGIRYKVKSEADRIDYVPPHGSGSQGRQEAANVADYTVDFWLQKRLRTVVRRKSDVLITEDNSQEGEYVKDTYFVAATIPNGTADEKPEHTTLRKPVGAFDINIIIFDDNAEDEKPVSLMMLSPISATLIPFWTF